MVKYRRNQYDRYEAIPVAVVIIGVLLRFIQIDNNEIVFYTGFLLFAIVGIAIAFVFKKEMVAAEQLTRLLICLVVAVLVALHFVLNATVIPFLIACMFFLLYVTEDLLILKLQNDERDRAERIAL